MLLLLLADLLQNQLFSKNSFTIRVSNGQNANPNLGPNHLEFGYQQMTKVAASKEGAKILEYNHIQI